MTRYLPNNRRRNDCHAFPHSSTLNRDRRAQSEDAADADGESAARYISVSDDIESFLEQQLSNAKTNTLGTELNHHSRLHVFVLPDDKEMLDEGRQQSKNGVLIFHQII